MINASHAKKLSESGKGAVTFVGLQESRHSLMSDGDKRRFADGVASFVGAVFPVTAASATATTS